MKNKSNLTIGQKFNDDVLIHFMMVIKILIDGLTNIEQLNNYFRQNEPVGKRINFLLQEINREINTIGSKSPQSDVTTYIVEMKSELEKIREQSQNIL